MDTSRREAARMQAIAVMGKIAANIDADGTVSRAEAAEAVGVAVSSLYRWLLYPPAKIDVAALSRDSPTGSTMSTDMLTSRPFGGRVAPDRITP